MRLYQALRDCGLDVAEPKGSFYLYPSFNPYSAKLETLGVKTSMQLAKWLIEECGIAALPGSAFGESDEGVQGGRLRLRMATSYLYFRSKEETYSKGNDLLALAKEGTPSQLPLLDGAIAALQQAVAKLK